MSVVDRFVSSIGVGGVVCTRENIETLIAVVRTEERERCAAVAWSTDSCPCGLSWSVHIAARIRARSLTPRTCGRHPPDVCCERCEPG